MPSDVGSASEFFVFEFLSPQAASSQGTPTRPLRTTVVFWTVRAMDAGRVGDRLRDRFEISLPPDRIALLAPEDCRDEMGVIVEETRLSNRVKNITQDSDGPLAGYVFDGRGTLTQTGEPVQAMDRDTLLLHGLRRLFNANGAMLDGRSRHHYAKPSGAHSSRFVRAAEALRNSTDTDFVAFGLLPYMEEGTRQIYTDSSSINTVGHSLVALRARLAPKNAYVATVDTFSSYRGISAVSPPDPTSCLCLISASTAGALARKVADEQGVPLSRIVTLFYAGEDTNKAGPVLCDMVTPVGPDAVAAISNYYEDGCPDCIAGIPTLTMTGDQFLPANALTTPVLVKTTDIPPTLSALIREVHSQRIVTCRVAGPGIGERPEFAFDLATLLGRPPAGPSLFQRLLEKAVPASTRWIVHLDDAASLLLAERAASIVNGLPPENLISSEKLSAGTNLPVLSGTTVVVVAADAGNGRPLLTLSQILRQQDIGLLCYVVGLARPSDPTAFVTVRSDLAFGAFGPKSHPIDSAIETCLPNTPAAETAFTRELNLLQALQTRTRFRTRDGKDLLPHPDLRAALAERIHVLTQGDVLGGTPALVDGLLLPSSCPTSNDNVLRLRPTFAFWRDMKYRSADVSQADVFLTISSVLHHLRQPGRGRQSLFDQDHNRGILAPGNLTRYNDGLTQGCFLRAARPGELDYHAEPDLSLEMLEILEVLIASRGRPAGEASSETLLAIATGQLKLTPGHTERLLAPLVAEIAAGTSDLGPMDQAFVLAAASG